jgi:hypothetical protein
MSYVVKALYMTGVGKRMHKSGDVLELKDIPGGAENVDKLISEGFIFSNDSTEDSEDDNGTPAEQAKVLIDSANESKEAGDLLGALEIAQQAVEVYPAGKKAKNLVTELEELLSEGSED